MDNEEDPCKTCLFQMCCREFCKEGLEYHKKQMFSKMTEEKRTFFKLELLLLNSGQSTEDFLEKYPEAIRIVDCVKDCGELYTIFTQKKKRKKIKELKEPLSKKESRFISKIKRLFLDKKSKRNNI